MSEQKYPGYGEQLKGIFGDLDVNIYDPSSIMGALVERYNLNPKFFRSNMFPAVDPETFKMSNIEHFKPLIDREMRKPGSALKKMQGRNLGGFASGGLSNLMKQYSLDKFGGAGSSVLSNILQQVQGNRSNVMETINDWLTTVKRYGGQ